MSELKYRVESDLLGELQVPADAYYGVQTQRAINNYKISTTHMYDYPEYIIAIAYVKMAAAFGHPVIASGGVAGLDDIVRLAQAEAEAPGSIEGVIAGRAIYEGALIVEEAIAACEEA